MSLTWFPMGAVIGTVIAQGILMPALNIQEPVLVWPITGIAAVLGIIAWLASPLPNVTGGVMRPSPEVTEE